MKILASIFKYLQLAEQIGALIPEAHVQAVDLLLTELTSQLQAPITQAAGAITGATGSPAPTVTGVSPAQAKTTPITRSPAQGK